MKWEKVFILLFNSIEDSIYFAANEARRRYRVPKSRCYAYRAIDNFWPLRSIPPPFMKCDLDSKLLIFAHGTRADPRTGETAGSYIGIDANRHIGGQALANLLYNHGLKEVGLISIKACHSANPEFITAFLNALTENKIKVGWILGYRGAITHSTSGKHIYTSRIDAITHSWFNIKIPDKYRVRIVEGNTRVINPNSPRYNHFTGMNLADFDDE
ncbi:hypothetical protein FE392_01000 [Xenorhabdus sp. 12]|uniref:Uncharacterized protein n=1 Tax=Xenorhabdus santafensis TaxID=2582833 RepID=A0ABU4S3X1_9GAMM|nr:hypothetical protein [Xenorhabdus sp. 12]MDX7985915.1 hypothetical protein [Xenorhabdus sp. 12]